MRSLLLAIALLWPAALQADDYRDLFNGKDLEGWVVEGPQKDKSGQPIWSVRDGMIVCTGKGFGFLRYTKQEFGDFAYRVEFRMSPRCNSGLGIRMPGPFDPAKSAETRPSYASYEIQLMDDAGKKPSAHGTGSLYRYVGPTANPIKPAGEWNTIEVECVGPRIKVSLNYQKVLDVDQTALADLKGDENKPASVPAPKNKPLKGFVALQSHSNQIEFRKVEIREIKSVGATNDPLPTEAAFAEQIKKLDREKDKGAKIEMLKWLSENWLFKGAESATPLLEKLTRGDPEVEVRREAVHALGRITRRLGKPCPLAIIEAILNTDEEGLVLTYAAPYAYMSESFEPGCVELLLQGVKSRNASVRAQCISILAQTGDKSRQVHTAILEAQLDKVWNVRHSAHIAFFQVTGRHLKNILPYYVLFRDYPEQDLPPGGEEREREKTVRKLILVGIEFQLIEWSESRPDEMARILLSLLDEKGTAFRRGAADLMGACAVKVELPDLDAPPKTADKPEGPPEPSKLALKLRELKACDHLRKLRDTDPDPTVREAAREALERLASVLDKKPDK